MNGMVKLLILAKTQKGLANQLGVTQAAVSKWAVKGYVPLSRVAQIVELYPTLEDIELIDPRIMK